VNRQRATKHIAGFISNGIFVGTGYCWGAYGIEWAALAAAATLVVLFALLGVFAYIEGPK